MIFGGQADMAGRLVQLQGFRSCPKSSMSCTNACTLILWHQVTCKGRSASTAWASAALGLPVGPRGALLYCSGGLLSLAAAPRSSTNGASAIGVSLDFNCSSCSPEVGESVSTLGMPRPESTAFSRLMMMGTATAPRAAGQNSQNNTEGRPAALARGEAGPLGTHQFSQLLQAEILDLQLFCPTATRDQAVLHRSPPPPYQ